MKLGSIPATVLRIFAFAAAALFSTMALAASLMWEFKGQTSDGTVLSATLSFESTEQPTQVITGTTQVITETVPVTTEYFNFNSLSFNLGYPGTNPVLTGTTTVGSIIQKDLVGVGFTDTYRIDATFESGVISYTGVIEISGPDLFNSLLTDVNKLQSNLPGSFNFSGYFGGPGDPGAGITSISDLTAPAIPEPWTLGLMLSGLGSFGFLSFAALRSRRAR